MHQSPQLLGSWQDLGSIEQVAAGVRERRIDPVDLADRALERAEAVRELNAVVHLDAERVRKDAVAARGSTGALAGVPVLVKEIVAVEGMPLTCGSRRFAGRTADSDADIVRRLRAAGAVVLGLSYSHEFAYGCTGLSNVEGPCRNPHDPRRITGGSSAGSAAGVAAGIVPLAIGTDTAGSVRIPGALCGIVGAMPTQRTLPRDGVFPLSSTLDHLGVFTQTVDDARFALAALTQGTLDGVEQPRLGVPTNPELLDSSPDVQAAFDAALQRLGGTVNVTLPDWPDVVTTAVDIQGPEAAAVHADLFPGHEDEYQPDVQERLRAAFAIPGWRYVQAKRHAADLAKAADDALRAVDAVVFPTLPIVSQPADVAEATVPSGTYAVRDLLIRNNRLANLTDHPTVTVPLPTQGLPIGLVVLAKDDRSVLHAARWIETALRT